jgi:deoxyribodipyrimidine photo-lyase
VRDDCPVQDWPPERARPRREDVPDRLLRDPDPDATAGPGEPVLRGSGPRAVWLTAESLGDADPALRAHPDLPVDFVFDGPLLARLRLSGKRLVFLAETLADLGSRRELRVHLGDPAEVLAGAPLAVTHAPVPGFLRRARRLDLAAVHPWPWLVRPHGGSAASYSAWRRAAGR